MRLSDKQFDQLVREVVNEVDADMGFEEIVAVVLDMGHDAPTANHVADELGRRRARTDGV